MERNPNDSLTGGMSGSTAGSSALGGGTDSISVTGTGAGQSASTGAMGGTTGGDVGSLDVGQSASQGSQNLKDQAADKLSQARDMAGERLGQAKEKATQLKATLADRLESGANALRSNQGAGSAQFAGVDGATSGAMQNDQMARLKTTGADVMQKSADFLRNGDLKVTVEEQMRTNPGRTLLIALGVGYLLGKAIRGGDRR